MNQQRLTGQLLRTGGWSAAYLAGFAAVAGAVSWILDAMSLADDRSDPMVFYTSWFVLGVFCGLLSYSSASEPIAPSLDRRLVLAGSFGFLVLTALVLHFTLWRTDEDWNYVPGDKPLTLTYFVAAAIGNITGYLGSKPVTRR